MTLAKPKAVCIECRFTKPLTKLGYDPKHKGAYVDENGRRISRIATTQSAICPHCQEVMIEFHPSIHVPKKSDNKAWKSFENKVKENQDRK